MHLFDVFLYFIDSLEFHPADRTKQLLLLIDWSLCTIVNVLDVVRHIVAVDEALSANVAL